ncbi:MAG TPA: response regulator [Terriglobales bacterium]|nr:response regulator [Terriglobales bacterium]
MSCRRILAYGEDPLVISTRAMILQRAGYEVVHTTRTSDLAPLLRGIFFDLLLIGDSLRTHPNVRLAHSLREQFPKLPIVMVQDEKEDRDSWSTAFVSSNPEQMLSEIDQILEEHYSKPVASEPAVANARAMHIAAGQ